MPEASLSFAFGLPPAAALAYFRRKGYAITWDYRDLEEKSHAIAMTVAKALRVDLLQDIRSAVDRAIADGQTLEEFRRGLEPTLKAKGWWGRQVVVDSQGGARVAQLGSPWRLATIYRTNLQSAFMAGRYALMKENESDRPYWMYVAIMDGKTRPAHAALNGRVLRSDDGFWRHFYPPNGYNCRCRVRALSSADLEARGLKVSRSSGHIKEEVGVDRDGVEYPTAWVKLPGMSQGVRPDQGFGFNPGAQAMKRFTPPPVDELNPFYVKLPQTLPPGAQAPRLPVATRVDPTMQLGDELSAREVAERFLADFGATLEREVTFLDVMGEPIVIGSRMVTNADGTLKSTKGSRARYLRLVGSAIREPDEIWLRWEESREQPGSWFLRRRYLKAFELEGGQWGLASFEEGETGWRGVTAFAPAADRSPAARLRYIEQYRGGFLLYSRPGA